jgi:hypothetical protein
MFQKGARKLIKTKITLQDKQQDELTFIKERDTTINAKMKVEGIGWRKKRLQNDG